MGNYIKDLIKKFNIRKSKMLVPKSKTTTTAAANEYKVEVHVSEWWDGAGNLFRTFPFLSSIKMSVYDSSMFYCCCYSR